MGRPSTYNEEMAERVLEAFATSRGSLHSAFDSRDDLPDLSTVYRWEEARPEFRERLNRAREKRAHVLAETCIEIADATEHDTLVKTGRDGTEYEVPNHEWINRSRLRFEARRWMAKTLNQRVYGEKSESSGTVEVIHRIHVGPRPTE